MSKQNIQCRVPRIGIYGTIPENSEFYQITIHILGYDPFRAVEARQDKIIAPYCGRAKTFGPHFTIYDIFTPKDYSALIKKLKELLKKVKSFNYYFSKFRGYVRGDYQGGSVYNTNKKTVLALDFDSKSVLRFKKVHELIIKIIQDHRDRIEPEFSKDLFKRIPELWALIEKYGAPYVLKNYSPHLTLASDLDGSEETPE